MMKEPLKHLVMAVLDTECSHLCMDEKKMAGCDGGTDVKPGKCKDACEDVQSEECTKCATQDAPACKECITCYQSKLNFAAEKLCDCSCNANTKPHFGPKFEQPLHCAGDNNGPDEKCCGGVMLDEKTMEKAVMLFFDN